MTINLPLYNKILVTLIDFIGIWLAIVVYRYGHKRRLNKIFLGMIILMFFWVNFAFLPRSIGQNNIRLSLIFLKIAWFTTPLLFSFLYLFVVYFLEREKESRFLTKTVLLLGVVSALIAGFTNLVVRGIKFTDGTLVMVYGKGIAPFLGAIFFFMCVTTYFLFKGYVRFPIQKRTQIEYLLAGIFIFYLVNVIFNIIFPLILRISHFYWIGDYSAIVPLVFIAYAIVRRELFGIKVILTQLLVGLFAILLLIQLSISRTISEFIWNGALFLIFLFFGYLLIKSIFKEIKSRDKIKRLDKRLLEDERKLTEVHREIAEERARRLEKMYLSTGGKELEIIKLKERIVELEEKLREE